MREVLKAEGFAALPRRLDEQRPERLQPTVEPVADVRAFSLAPQLTTQANLARLDRMKIDFITLRRRSPALLCQVYGLPRQMRGYAEAQARQIFRDLLDLPAQVEITEQEVRVEFHRRVTCLLCWLLACATSRSSFLGGQSGDGD